MGKTFKMPPLPPKFVPKPPTVDSASAGAEVVRTVGFESLMENLLALPQYALDAAGREMAVIASEVIDDAQETYVPIDKGDLKDSGDSDDWVSGMRDLQQIAMWFGGEPTAEQATHGAKDVRKYALEQHENLELHHPPLKDRVAHINAEQFFRPGGAKYLELPFSKKIPSIYPRIADAVAATLGTNASFVKMALTSDPSGNSIAPPISVDPNTGGKS